MGTRQSRLEERIEDPFVGQNLEAERLRRVDRDVQVLVVGDGEDDGLIQRQRDAPLRGRWERHWGPLPGMDRNGPFLCRLTGRVRGPQPDGHRERAGCSPSETLHSVTPYCHPFYAGSGPNVSLHLRPGAPPSISCEASRMIAAWKCSP